MAAFAQFGSDLDKATQDQLANGERQTEMLKQGQYKPLPMEEQVVSLYAATPPEGRDSWVRGFEVGDLTRYEEELLLYVRAEHADLLGRIRESGQLSDDDEAELAAALDEFGNAFQATSKATEAA